MFSSQAYFRAVLTVFRLAANFENLRARRKRRFREHWRGRTQWLGSHALIIIFDKVTHVMHYAHMEDVRQLIKSASGEMEG
ncbi:MAG: hypothetical protein CMK09_02695 [Ponticaulis sp.]|nr:hypothetical protein [Ponticaulis sp.]